MARPTSTVPFRILCLHDEESNARALQQTLQLLGDRLCQNHAIDLVYVNSPLVVLSKNNNQNENNDDDGDPLSDSDSEHRVWWWACNKETQQSTTTSTKIQDENNQVNSSSSDNNILPVQSSEDVVSKNYSSTNTEFVRYCGLDASLMMLRQMWKSSPFWGIIGIGQGAAIASLFILTLLLPQEPPIGINDDDEDDDDEALLPPIDQLLPPPQLVIFIDGYSLLSAETNKLIDDENQIRTLHLIRSSESTNGKTRQNRDTLVQQFGGIVHTMRTCTKSDDDIKLHKLHNTDLNLIGRFIIEQKSKLVGGNRTALHEAQQQQQLREIVALQTALHMVEMEASNVIADHVLKNPPSALMAVIRPQVVAGLDSNQKPRRPVGTGGAPCPVEFLQRKDQRYPPSSSSNQRKEESEEFATASRAHPGQVPT